MQGDQEQADDWVLVVQAARQAIMAAHRFLSMDWAPAVPEPTTVDGESVAPLGS